MKEIDFDMVIKTMDAAGKIAESMKDKYGIIHKQAFVNYYGKEGRIVWDYIIYNELTFEDAQTGEKRQLGISFSDKKMEDIFNEFVKKFGV